MSAKDQEQHVLLASQPALEPQPIGSLTCASIDRLRVGDSASCRITIGARHIDAFAELSGDNNPLHMDDEFAQQLGFDGRVAHGMLPLSAVSRLIGTQLPGPGALWVSQEVEFVAPVRADDTLEAQVTVEKISRAAQIVVLRTEVINTSSGTIVLRGNAKVRIPLHSAQRRPDKPAANTS